MHGMNQLKRLFGTKQVSEDLISPPTYYGKAEPCWCYVIEIAANSPAIGSPPKDNFELTSAVSNLAALLTDRIDNLPYHIFDTQMPYDPVTESCNIPRKPLRLIIPCEDVENPETVKALSALSLEALQHAAFHSKADDTVFNTHCDILRKASHGLRWQFKSDANGEYYETTRNLKRPRELQMALLYLLGRPDHEMLGSVNDHARISLDSMLQGYIPNLQEWSTPRPRTSRWQDSYAASDHRTSTSLRL